VGRVSSKPYNKKKTALVAEFEDFLSRCGDNTTLAWVTPQHVVRFLVWKDQRGKTQFHDVSCEYIGKPGIQACGCPTRLTSGSVSNIISQLKSFFRSVGFGSHWSVVDSKGNPVAAPLVQDYLIGFRAEGAESHVVPQQAKPLFVDKLFRLCKFWQNELDGYLCRNDRFVILRDRAFFTLQYFSGKRANDLTYLLGQELRLLSDGTGFSIRLTVGKQWQGEEHNDFVIKRCAENAICPCTALERYFDWAVFLGINLKRGFVFRALGKDGSVTDRRWTAESAYKQLKSHLQSIGLDQGETPHGIRGAHAITVLLKGVEPSVAMSHVGWKTASTFSHYSRMPTFESDYVAKTLASEVLDRRQQEEYNELNRENMRSFPF
jgi:hypothetical protein